MHPKKNRCITFWGGWKNRGLETNAMTLRHIDMGLCENIDIDKGILQNIDIDKISYRLEFGISNRAMVIPFNSAKTYQVCEKPT